MKNHEAKKELLSDDVRVFGIRIGNNNNVKFEDAEYKISILVRNIPYQISIADFKQFFNALCDENDCECNIILNVIKNTYIKLLNFCFFKNIF